QARCQPMARGWGGGLVVVRVRESRAHGEGDQQVSRKDAGMPGGTLVKTGAPGLEWLPLAAERRVLEIQTRLHRWAAGDPHHRFDDLFNLVADPAFLMVAWDRVRGNKGAKTPGVDGRTAVSVQVTVGVEQFLGELRSSLKDRTFAPLPVRERMIPKAGGKLRRL